MRAALERAFDRLVREPLLLLRAERRAEGYTEPQRERLARLSRAASTRHAAAQELRREEVRGAALALEREAALLALTGLLVARGEHDADHALPTAEAWARFDALLPSLEGVPDAVRISRSLLSSSDPLTPERLDGDVLAQRDAAEATIEWLLAQYEPRSLPQIARQRRLRLAAVVLGALLVVVAGLFWARQPHNLARGKSVLASSQRPGTPDPSGVVDGWRGGNFGVHTNQDDPPWIEIDLGATHQLTRAVIVNRGDGYEDEVLPLALQLSNDDQTWQEIEVRHDRFTQHSPWRVVLGGARARFVRVIKPEAGYIALSEIEIYGR
jgi:hypothetical protein